nr:iron-sulfur cluster assembly 1 homolog, mitochondrial [Chrysemys picta bellii]
MNPGSPTVKVSLRGWRYLMFSRKAPAPGIRRLHETLGFHLPLKELSPLVVMQESLKGASKRTTPSAVHKIKQLLKDKPDHVGVKVGVRTRGCNGLSYTLDYTKTKGDSDEEVVQDGVRVFIEKKAQLTLLGTEMDYVEDKLSSEFVFNNPNIKGTCGCGESFNI